MFFEKKDRTVVLFWAALFAFILSKGQALVPGMGLDDYTALHLDRNPLFYLWQGRFTQALIQVLLTKLGLAPTAMSFPVIVLFFVFGSMAIALGVLYVARNRGHVVALASVAALMASFPYLTEYFTFRESLVTQGFAFTLMALVFALSRAGRPASPLARAGRFSAIVVAMVLLGGAQQTAFIVLGFFLFSRIVIDYVDTTQANDQTANAESKSMLLAYLCACIAYVVVYLIIKKMTDIPLDARSSVIGLSELQGRLGQIGKLAGKILFLGEPTVSLAMKNYLTYIVGILFVLVALARPKAAIVVAAAACLMFAGSIVLVSISGVWWPVPRAVYGFGFALALVLLLLHLLSRASIARYYAVAVGIAALGLAFHSSAILYDQIRLNRWDAWVAGNIVRELAAAGVTGQQRIVLVGAGYIHPLGPPTSDGDLNASALVKPWTATDLFAETTGRPWKVDSVGMAPECGDSVYWPAEGAIKRGKDAIYVCMGKR